MKVFVIEEILNYIFFLYIFFTTESLMLKKKQKLFLWSDNCYGQNKNKEWSQCSKLLWSICCTNRTKKGESLLRPRVIIKIIANVKVKNLLLVVNKLKFIDWMKIAEKYLDTEMLW